MKKTDESQLEDFFIITKETMQVFVENHGNFLKGVELWMLTQAEHCDPVTLNHFQYYFYIIFKECCKRISENLGSIKTKGNA